MTSTASDRPKSDLLDTVITAYGDLDRWRSLDQLTAKVSAGGVLWGLKGQPGILTDYTLTLTPNLQSDTLAPFAAPDLRAAGTISSIPYAAFSIVNSFVVCTPGPEWPVAWVSA